MKTSYTVKLTPPILENQKVISTDHTQSPAKRCTRVPLCTLLGTPLALGSYWGLVPSAGMMAFLVWRLFDVERFLAGIYPAISNTKNESATALRHS